MDGTAGLGAEEEGAMHGLGECAFPGITSTGAFNEPIAPQATDMVALVTCGESNKSPATTMNDAPVSLILTAMSRSA